MPSWTTIDTCGGSVHRSQANKSLLELRNPALDCICAVCGRPFDRKKLPHIFLSDSEKLLCMENSEEMRRKRQFHVIHSFCAYTENCCRKETNEKASPSSVQTTRIGLDVGGVIVPGNNQHESREDTLLSDTGYKKQQPLPDCIDVCTHLVERRGTDNVLIVSKAGERVEQNTQKWFAHIQFWKKTGISPKNVHFVRERKDKGPLCARLGVNVFCDDNLSVLQHFEPGTRLIYFKATESPVDCHSALYYHPDVELCHSWKELEQIMG